MRLSRVRSVSVLTIICIVLVANLPIQALSEQAEVQVEIRAVNLNKEPIPDVTVEVYNATTESEAPVMSEKTNETGWVKFSLLNDTYYSFKAFWKNVQVGSLPKQRILSNVTIDNFNCSLAHVKVTVIDEANVPLPLITMTLTYSYLTRYNETIPEKISFETNENGTIVASNMIINANYTIEALRYGLLFNTTLLPNLNLLLDGGWANLTITCPKYALFIHVFDSSKLPLPRVKVDAYEWSSQILAQSGTTNDSGSVTFNCIFGKYKIRVYSYSAELNSTVLLNETVTDLIEDKSFLAIHCKIFNLTPSVAVVDFFRQPIPNAMIEIERRIEQDWVKIEPLRKTDSYGVASLPKIGGDYRISVYVMGGLCETRTLYLDESRLILFKMDKYVMVGGNPLETSQLIIYVSLIPLIALLILAYRRSLKRIIRKKTPSQKSTITEKSL